jgi:2-keto-4-pentenoate hydratase/2-oxohepta-3-ene-1,7-dioic acid hydratase in catechol pathway
LVKPPDGPLRRQPTASLDVEVELGAVIGTAGKAGRPVPAE